MLPHSGRFVRSLLCPSFIHVRQIFLRLHRRLMPAFTISHAEALEDGPTPRRADHKVQERKDNALALTAGVFPAGDEVRTVEVAEELFDIPNFHKALDELPLKAGPGVEVNFLRPSCLIRFHRRRPHRTFSPRVSKGSRGRPLPPPATLPPLDLVSLCSCPHPREQTGVPFSAVPSCCHGRALNILNPQVVSSKFLVAPSVDAIHRDKHPQADKDLPLKTCGWLSFSATNT